LHSRPSFFASHRFLISDSFALLNPIYLSGKWPAGSQILNIIFVLKVNFVFAMFARGWIQRRLLDGLKTNFPNIQSGEDDEICKALVSPDRCTKHVSAYEYLSLVQLFSIGLFRNGEQPTLRHIGLTNDFWHDISQFHPANRFLDIKAIFSLFFAHTGSSENAISAKMVHDVNLMSYHYSWQNRIQVHLKKQAP
jgi:hypothetical protein